jgi:tetratricopeptide (TPR) repeat protein
MISPAAEAALAELNAILYGEHKLEDRKAAAESYIRKAVAEKTGIAEEYAAKAMMMTFDGDAAGAEAFLTREVLEKDGGGARIFAALGQAQRAQGKNADARRAFKAAHDADWRNPRFAQLIGESYLEEGDAANASAYFQKGQQSSSEHFGSAIGLARTRILQGSGLKEAGDTIKAGLEKASSLTPALKARLYVAKAELELVEQKFDEAIASASQAGEADPSFAWSFAARAKAEALKKDANAIASFEKAVAADPYVAAFYFDATRYLIGGGLDTAKALSFLDKWPSQLKKDDRYFVEYGNALRSLERFDEALAKYDEAIAANETNATAYVNKGAILRLQKKYDEAGKAFETATIAKEFYPELYVEKAMLAFEKKEYEAGLQEYATALSQWRQARASREQLTGKIAEVKDLLMKAGQRQYASAWESEATDLIR